MREIRAWAAANPVDVHVPVDSPAANWHIASWMKRHGRGAAGGSHVVNLVAPQLWAWAPWRIRKWRRTSDAILCLLPFEEAWFRARGVRAHFVGHPVLAHPIDAAAHARAAAFPQGAPRLLLLPGSRSSEVRANLPTLMRVHADLQSRFRKMTSVLVAANEDLLALVRERLGGTLPSGLNLVVGQLDAAIAWSDLALCVSGTVSMDLARQAKPMVAVYKVSPISWLGARMLLTTPHRLLPNILAGERIVPEFVPHMGGVGPISKAAEQLLTDQKRMR
ncbi:MAG: lipid-A-disaccharide synthase, partial [Phycisphaerales bacterium]